MSEAKKIDIWEMPDEELAAFADKVHRSLANLCICKEPKGDEQVCTCCRRKIKGR